MPALLDQIRTRCRAVAERASFVRIDLDAIPAYAGTLPPEADDHPEHDPHCHYLGHGDDTAAFFITLDAINFGSGYFPELRKRSGMSGYFTVASSLADHFESHGPFSALDLRDLRPETCTRIFGQDPANGPIQELMRLFARALNDLGRHLLDRYDGSFVGLIREANGSAEALVGSLADMPTFRDVAHYGDLEVPFYKRAQITAADLFLAFDGQGLGRFDDLERLTIFADNVVPHVLRLDGVLRYRESLVERICNGELIPSGSEEEVEIRACAVHAVELLVQACRRADRAITARELDALLWTRGRGARYKSVPRHRTRTVFY